MDQSYKFEGEIAILRQKLKMKEKENQKLKEELSLKSKQLIILNENLNKRLKSKKLENLFTNRQYEFIDDNFIPQFNINTTKIDTEKLSNNNFSIPKSNIKSVEIKNETINNQNSNQFINYEDENNNEFYKTNISTKDEYKTQKILETPNKNIIKLKNQIISNSNLDYDSLKLFHDNYYPDFVNYFSTKQIIKMINKIKKNIPDFLNYFELFIENIKIVEYFISEILKKIIEFPKLKYYKKINSIISRDSNLNIINSIIDHDLINDFKCILLNELNEDVYIILYRILILNPKIFINFFSDSLDYILNDIYFRKKIKNKIIELGYENLIPIQYLDSDDEKIILKSDYKFIW